MAVGVERFGKGVGRRYAVPDVDADVGEEEDEEGEGVEDEDVGDVVHAGGFDESHLFFGSAHEEEAGGVEELWLC